MQSTIEKVLIVEDSAAVRQYLAHVIDSDAGLQVVGMAKDGVDGVIDAIMTYGDHNPPRDDVTLLGLEFKETSALTQFEVVLYFPTSHHTSAIRASDQRGPSAEQAP